MTDPTALPALLKLQTWLSPSFPVGAYTYSQGLEWAVETGEVADADALLHWLRASFDHGALKQDAALCVRAWRLANDLDALATLIELASALPPSEERLLETQAQGAAFIKAVRAGWPELVGVTALAAAPYPVAVGAVAARAGIGLDAALGAFLHAGAANLISAGIRLIPLGQSDGVRLIAALEGDLIAAVQAAIEGAEDPAGLGAFSPLADIASMQHETQYTRLFRS
ncbi:MAG: urease accessory protein UreF [Alphaproteobacteria bacterium]|nr:urease accessory protein UreF [Alphaproteobacteria bacterium]